MPELTNTQNDPLGTLMEEAAARSRERIEDGGEVLNHFLAQTEEGRLGVIVTPWRSDAERAAMLAGVRRKFEELRVVRYCHVAEAWMSERLPGDSLDIRPSQDPKRIEALLIYGIDSEPKAKRMICFPIETVSSGKRKLGDPFPSYELFEGESLRLLDREPRWMN